MIDTSSACLKNLHINMNYYMTNFKKNFNSFTAVSNSNKDVTGVAISRDYSRHGPLSPYQCQATKCRKAPNI